MDGRETRLSHQMGRLPVCKKKPGFTLFCPVHSKKGSDLSIRTERGAEPSGEPGSRTGTVNPNGYTVTAIRFEYGTTGAYGQTLPVSPSTASGSQNIAVTASGLDHTRVYHYRLIVETDAGDVIRTPDQTFDTSSKAGLWIGQVEITHVSEAVSKTDTDTPKETPNPFDMTLLLHAESNVRLLRDVTLMQKRLETTDAAGDTEERVERVLITDDTLLADPAGRETGGDPSGHSRVRLRPRKERTGTLRRDGTGRFGHRQHLPRGQPSHQSLPAQKASGS